MMWENTNKSQFNSCDESEIIVARDAWCVRCLAQGYLDCKTGWGSLSLFFWKMQGLHNKIFRVRFCFSVKSLRSSIWVPQLFAPRILHGFCIMRCNLDLKYALIRPDAELSGSNKHQFFVACTGTGTTPLKYAVSYLFKQLFWKAEYFLQTLLIKSWNWEENFASLYIP